ncbi:hypothetical protein A3F55_00015 [Candidatus Adlerbacteria bacterium RIFCSPHIGHO2_12_FULL_53_18]|uniref:Uncharacterized protein n=1 Tax=Candidatus Adlerbacteria bacterium RIFCSPHIGHO2_12_FULL_53_18 TaxID=1797242 RepID=A0A1F4XT41_9BACT|nr:MAG: hypothetical protein A3F55_00015 [Candidatus Adlerbacteria bacterium RIFCSPHIGHO2_12_FULL_53_18]
MRQWVIFALGLVSLQALALYFLGQPTFCECGRISLWANEVLSPENSQQFFDWYTFSHVIHGFLFYWLATLLFPRLPVGARLLIAVGVEAGWEVFENTPMVIEHYRQQALAQGYIGDSILNSVMDTLSAVLGFFLAWRLPVWATVLLAAGLEGFVLYMIRDSLVLNILGFFLQPEFISKWQQGG